MARNTRTITTARRPDVRYETSGTLAMDPELEARLRAHREARMQARKEERRRPRKEKLERLETPEQLRAASIAAELTHTEAIDIGTQDRPARPRRTTRKRADGAGVSKNVEAAGVAGAYAGAESVRAQRPEKAVSPNRVYQRKQAMVLLCLGLAATLFVGSIVTMLLQKAHIATQTMQNDAYRKQVEAQQKLNEEMLATLGMGDDLATIRERARTEFGMDNPTPEQIRTFALPAVPEAEGVDVQMPSADGANAPEELLPELR